MTRASFLFVLAAVALSPPVSSQELADGVSVAKRGHGADTHALTIAAMLRLWASDGTHHAQGYARRPRGAHDA